MTADDILDIIGDARGEYLLEAQAFREIQMEPGEAKRIPLRKIILIAAVIALALALVGCTVVYVLSLQEMKVGEHTFTEPSYINEDGQTVAAEEKTTALVSLQGIYQGVLEEWIAFCDSYDPDKALLIANDNNESDVPEPYHTTYGCYTWEMVNKLDEIIRKYDLKLLDSYIVMQAEESDILFKALNIDNVHKEYAEAQVEYGSGYFYPEGTFQIAAYVTLENANWPYENLIELRYSLKEYFDPVSGSVGDIDSYTQWTYTTGDGIPMLLAMNEEHAHIYVNLEDAFISVQTDAFGRKGQETVPMTKETLEKIAEVFDFTVKPQSADLSLVRNMQAEIAAQKETEAAAAKAEKDAIIAQGYEAYLAYRLELGDIYELGYTLYDLNGDGTEELILRDGGGFCHEILSMKSGESYLYFDARAVTANVQLFPCDDNQFMLYSNYGQMERYKVYQAGAESVEYIEGLTYNETEEKWYYLPDNDPWTNNEKVINKNRALGILNGYATQALGEPKKAEEFLPESITKPSDPYAALIAQQLEGEFADQFRFTLLDLTRDGMEELILEGPLFHGDEQIGTCLDLYSQENGELVSLNVVIVQYVCKDNVLESCRIAENGAEYHQYYELAGTGVRILDMIEYDPLTDTWTRDQDGPWGETAVVITQSKARQIIGSHPRMTLDWKPLTEYPVT